MIVESISAAPNPSLHALAPPIQRALEWIENIEPDLALGTYEIEGDDIYAMVQQRDSESRAERDQVEAHREYADLHFCVSGGEVIDWYALSDLGPGAGYQNEGDYELYARPAAEPLAVLLRPGRFVVLRPQDAHVPKVSDGLNSTCRMIVVKIRDSLLGGAVEQLA